MVAWRNRGEKPCIEEIGSDANGDRSFQGDRWSSSAGVGVLQGLVEAGLTNAYSQGEISTRQEQRERIRPLTNL